MSQRKIVLIGAGSVKFTQGLLADELLTEHKRYLPQLE